MGAKSAEDEPGLPSLHLTTSLALPCPGLPCTVGWPQEAGLIFPRLGPSAHEWQHLAACPQAHSCSASKRRYSSFQRSSNPQLPRREQPQAPAPLHPGTQPEVSYWNLCCCRLCCSRLCPAYQFAARFLERLAASPSLNGRGTSPRCK